VYAIDLSNNTSAPSNQAQANTYINGFFWEHSTGAYTDIRNIPAEVWANPEFKGRSTNLTLTPRTQEEFLVFRFYGYIYVSTAGDYLFRVRSNDGVQLYVDGTLVLRRNGTVADGSCATTNFTSGIPPVTLAPGPHTIEVRYFQYTGDKCLSIQWRGPDAGSDLTKFYDVPDSRIRSYDTYTPPAAPDVPQSLVATAAGMTQINLSWAYSGTPTPEFEIQRSMTSNGPFTIINRVSTLTYSDQNLKPGTTYYYRLRSVNDNGSSAFTPVASATTDLDTEAPTAPTNLVLYSKTINNASIGWTKSTDNTGVTGYEIWVNNVLNTTTPNNFYLLTNLQPFTDYSVYVVAYDANGNKSAASNTIQFTLNEPQIFYSKAGSAPLNDLATWGANPDGTGTAPSSFSTNGLYLYVANRTTTSIGGSWKVEGSASKVIVPDGVTLTADNSLQARVEVQDNATLILANAVVPTLVDLGSASTVQYNQSATSVFKTTYGNLILSGTGSKTFSSGTTTVLGALTASNGIALKGAAGNQSVIAFSGDVTFSGSPGITPADVSVAMQFSKAGTQTITSSGSMDLFQIKTATGTNLNLLNAGTAVTFNVGSSNGGGISIASGSTLNLNNNTLKLSGAGTINGNGETGTISVNSSTIDITSTSSLNQNLYFDAVNNSLYYLGINLGGSGVANVNTAIQVTEGLKIKKGTLNANGNVTLVSTEAKTANLQEIENNGKVLGDVKVQRYVNYKSRTYRYISSPVAGLKIADWQAYFPITGTFSGASTGTGLTSNPSLFYFYEPTGWIAYPTTSNQELIEKGKGYSAFIRNTEPFVLQMTGNPYQGDVVFALTPPNGDNTGWNLLGNPYASTIAWSNDPSAWIKTNINSVVAVRNNSSTSVGEFEYYDAATGTGTGTGGTLAGGRIAPGQAFYVRTTGPSPALTITEKAKSTGQQTFFREENETYPQLKISVTQGQKVDRAFLVFTDFGTNKFDAKWDGVKLKNDGLFNLSTMSEDNIALAINNASGDFCTQEIRLNLQNVTAGSYSLSAELLETLVGVSDVTLKDNFTNNIIDLKKHRRMYSLLQAMQLLMVTLASHLHSTALKLARHLRSKATTYVESLLALSSPLHRLVQLMNYTTQTIMCLARRRLLKARM
jgi:hypothetical protein